MPSLFKVVTLRDDIYAQIKSVTNRIENFSIAVTTSGYSPQSRHCKTAYINGPLLNSILFPIVQKINIAEKWNFKLVDPNSYSFNRYEVGDFYKWHTDGNLNDSKTYVRKISFSLGMSSDYEGGNFLIQTERTNDFSKMPYTKFNLKERQLIVFKSDVRHCVEEVTGGKRDSLVGWIYGPKNWNL